MEEFFEQTINYFNERLHFDLYFAGFSKSDFNMSSNIFEGELVTLAHRKESSPINCSFNQNKFVLKNDSQEVPKPINFEMRVLDPEQNNSIQAKSTPKQNQIDENQNHFQVQPILNQTLDPSNESKGFTVIERIVNNQIQPLLCQEIVPTTKEGKVTLNFSYDTPANKLLVTELSQAELNQIQNEVANGNIKILQNTQPKYEGISSYNENWGFSVTYRHPIKMSKNTFLKNNSRPTTFVSITFLKDRVLPYFFHDL